MHYGGQWGDSFLALDELMSILFKMRVGGIVYGGGVLLIPLSFAHTVCSVGELTPCQLTGMGLSSPQRLYWIRTQVSAEVSPFCSSD